MRKSAFPMSSRRAKGAKDKAVDAAKSAADAARKTGVYVALWAFISLLVGAFSASYMATVGGRERDDLPMMRLDSRRFGAPAFIGGRDDEETARAKAAK